MLIVCVHNDDPTSIHVYLFTCATIILFSDVHMHVILKLQNLNKILTVNIILIHEYLTTNIHVPSTSISTLGVRSNSYDSLLRHVHGQSRWTKCRPT